MFVFPRRAASIWAGTCDACAAMLGRGGKGGSGEARTGIKSFAMLSAPGLRYPCESAAAERCCARLAANDAQGGGPALDVTALVRWIRGASAMCCVPLSCAWCAGGVCCGSACAAGSVYGSAWPWVLQQSEGPPGVVPASMACCAAAGRGECVPKRLGSRFPSGGCRDRVGVRGVRVARPLRGRCPVWGKGDVATVGADGRSGQAEGVRRAVRARCSSKGVWGCRRRLLGRLGLIDK